MKHLDTHTQAQWDRFDICEAWYCYAMEWHGGQWSKEYEIFAHLNRMRFNPRPSLNNSDCLDTNAREIYDDLVKEHQS
jgi:hypothetical protein